MPAQAQRLKLRPKPAEPPAPDDGPDPELLTPRRVAARLRRMAMTATSLAHDLRELAFPLGRPNVEPAHDELMRAAAGIVDLAVNVRSGIVAIRPDYLDAERTPPRELLDYIEGRPKRDAADAVAPAIAARGANGTPDTDPAFEAAEETGPAPGRCRVCGCTDDDCSQCIEATGEPCYWVESDLCSRCAPAGTDPELGPAVPARRGAKRRKSGRQKPRRKPTFAFDVAVMDAHGRFVELGGILPPTNDPDAALIFAKQAYAGGQFTDSAGKIGPIDTSKLKVLRSKPPAKAKKGGGD